MATEATISTRELWSGGNRPMGASYGKLMMWFFLLSDALSFSGFLGAYGVMRFKYQLTWPIAEDVFTHFPFLHGDHPLLYVALMTFILIMSSVTMVLAVNAGHQNNKKNVIIWMALTIVGGAIFLGSQAWEWYHFIVGDKGAIEVADAHVRYKTAADGTERNLSDSRIAHFVDAQGKVVSLGTLVHGEGAHGHGHHERFTSEQVREAFMRNPEIGIKFPGKSNWVLSHEEAAPLVNGANVVQGANMVQNEYGRSLFANFFFFITGFHGFHVFSGVVINFIIFLSM